MRQLKKIFYFCLSNTFKWKRIWSKGGILPFKKNDFKKFRWLLYLSFFTLTQMKKWKNKKEEPGPPSKSTSNARTPSPKKGLSKSAESISQPPNRPLPRWDAFNLRNLGQPLFQNGTPTASTAEDERGKKMQEHIQFEQGSKIHEDEQGVSIKLRYSVGEHRRYRYWLESIDDIETDWRA